MILAFIKNSFGIIKLKFNKKAEEAMSLQEYLIIILSIIAFIIIMYLVVTRFNVSRTK